MYNEVTRWLIGDILLPVIICIVSIIIGFISGRISERKSMQKNAAKVDGVGNTVIQNNTLSTIGDKNGEQSSKNKGQ